MQAYSQDLRDRVLRAVARGERPTDIAKRFEVSRVWVYQVAQRYRSSGERGSLQVGRLPPLAGGASGSDSARLDQGRARPDLG